MMKSGLKTGQAGLSRWLILFVDKLGWKRLTDKRCEVSPGVFQRVSLQKLLTSSVCNNLLSLARIYKNYSLKLPVFQNLKEYSTEMKVLSTLTLGKGVSEIPLIFVWSPLHIQTTWLIAKQLSVCGCIEWLRCWLMLDEWGSHCAITTDIAAEWDGVFRHIEH